VQRELEHFTTMGYCILRGLPAPGLNEAQNMGKRAVKLSRVMGQSTGKTTRPMAQAIDEFAAHFDSLFKRLSQRENFRYYLSGLVVPIETNKHLRGIAAAVPEANVESVQHFLVDAPWSAPALNAQRLALLQDHPLTRWHAEGVLIIDETGDRKKGKASAYVSRQYLGSIGKIDNGVVRVSSHWADESVHYPLNVLPYTAAERLPEGKNNPQFATKPQLAQQLIEETRQAGVLFRAVVGDSFYGEHYTAILRKIEAIGQG
jgi:SRSO17 transposase